MIMSSDFKNKTKIYINSRIQIIFLQLKKKQSENEKCEFWNKTVCINLL